MPTYCVFLLTQASWLVISLPSREAVNTAKVINLAVDMINKERPTVDMSGFFTCQVVTCKTWLDCCMSSLLWRLEKAQLESWKAHSRALCSPLTGPIVCNPTSLAPPFAFLPPPFHCSMYLLQGDAQTAPPVLRVTQTLSLTSVLTLF